MKQLARRARASRPCAEEDRHFPKLTARAQVAMTHAHREALRRGDERIGTEHLLLGLLVEGDGIAAQVLRDCGVALEPVRAAVAQLRGPSAGLAPGKRALPVTPRLKRVLALADEEAGRLRHRYIGTEHLLLGLLAEGEGVGADILRRGGVTLERARAQVRDRLARVGQPVASEAEPAASTAVMCRLDARSLAALDALIEAGVRTTRSDAVAWLVQAGLEANAPLLATVRETVAEIRRLRAEAQALARQALPGDAEE
ncbi:MAG TPA: Clp protease N-terminal domain-containing protein [Thermomicrobiales bacterium]|nr:Clp protease N-terminal domain-containing protein [Thermomicrobiales bacterium]